MSIDNLTLGEIRAVMAMFGQVPAQVQAHPFVGRMVLCRCAQAGVHAGVLVSQSGSNVILARARRLWKWQAKQGVALSGVAIHGLVVSGSTLDTIVPEIALTDVIETIPMSDLARDTVYE